MPIQVGHDVGDLGAIQSRILLRDGRQVDIVETLDQWYGPDHHYVKVKSHDGGLYILRFDQSRCEWTLIMFHSARGQALTKQ